MWRCWFWLVDRTKYRVMHPQGLHDYYLSFIDAFFSVSLFRWYHDHDQALFFFFYSIIRSSTMFSIWFMCFMKCLHLFSTTTTPQIKHKHLLHTIQTFDTRTHIHILHKLLSYKTDLSRYMLMLCWTQSSELFHWNKHPKKIKYKMKQTTQNTNWISARDAKYRLWPGVKIPTSIPRRRYNRLKGAYMGLNSFDWQLELWPKAHWGNCLLLCNYKKSK